MVYHSLLCVPHFVKTLHYAPSTLVALHGMAHSFIESCKLLHHNKAVIHEGQMIKDIQTNLEFSYRLSLQVYNPFLKPNHGPSLFPRASLLAWVWLLILKQHCDPAPVLLSCSVEEVLPPGTWLEACLFMPPGGRPADIGPNYGPCDSVLAPINCSPRPILSTQKSAQCPVRSPPRGSMRTTFIYTPGNRSTIYGPRSKLSSQLQSNRLRSWMQSYRPRDHIEFMPAQGPGNRPGNTWLSSTWLTAVPETISSFCVPDRRRILPAEISL